MDKIKCKYIFDDNYNPKYVNGAQGGINPQGEIVINFYFERNALPVSHTLVVKDSLLTNEITEVEPKDLNNSFVRIIENGVVMNYSTAKEVYKWLGKHLESLEELTQKS